MKKIDIASLRKREVMKRESSDSDPRFVNDYDLKEGESMTIRLLPDGGESGNF